MKSQLLLCFFLLLGFSTLQAQTESGTILIGGSPTIGFSPNFQSLELDPQVGYFVLNNWVVGLGTDARFSLTRYRPPTLDAYRWDFDVNLAPFLFSRYYFLPGKKWRPFIHAESGYLGKNIFSMAGGGGVALFVKDYLSLNFAFIGQAAFNNQNLSYSVRGIDFGVNFFLNTRKKDTAD